MTLRSKLISSSVEDPTSERVHVAVREVKEESYRALRWAGYSWGQSQSAGRISSVSEIIWGTGISSAISDVSRRFISQRSIKLIQNTDEIEINTRGLSTIMAASFAIAISQSQPGIKVFIKGSDCGPDVSAAVWDAKRKPDTTISWGKADSSEVTDLSVLENGDLISHLRQESMNSIPKQYSSLWFVMCHSETITGDLILSKKEKEERVDKALISGLDVSQINWQRLTSKSFKFLVPE
jgi:hypothetical protein